MRSLVCLPLLISIVLLSGCTIEDYFSNGDGVEIGEGTLDVELTSDLSEVRAADDEYTYLTLILRNLDAYDIYNTATYEIEVDLTDKGLFDSYEVVSEDGEGDTIDLAGRKEVAIDLKLYPPNYVPAKTATQVQFQGVVTKEVTFPVKILFADRDYLAGMEMRGEDIPTTSDVMTYSDHFITMTIDLNKNPPIENDYTYANIHFSPRQEGIIEIESIDIEGREDGDGSCDDFTDEYEYATDFACTFSGESDDLTEIEYDLIVEYSYTFNMYHTFTLLPSGEGEYVPGGDSTKPSKPSKAPSEVSLGSVDLELEFSGSRIEGGGTTNLDLTIENGEDEEVKITNARVDKGEFASVKVKRSCEETISGGDELECGWRLTAPDTISEDEEVEVVVTCEFESDFSESFDASDSVNHGPLRIKTRKVERSAGDGDDDTDTYRVELTVTNTGSGTLDLDTLEKDGSRFCSSVLGSYSGSSSQTCTYTVGEDDDFELYVEYSYEGQVGETIDFKTSD